MYEAILLYGIRIRIPNPKYVDDVLLKEYGLEFAHDQFITVNERVTILLPCVGRSETHSLNIFVREDWDDRLHRYAADAKLTGYNIGWHVYLPETKPETSLKNLTLDPSKANWTGTSTDRFDSSKPNISNPPKTSYTRPTIQTIIVPKAITEEQERLLDEFFAAEASGKVVIKTVSAPPQKEDFSVIPDQGSVVLPSGVTLSPKETLHSIIYGDLVDHGDGTWTCMYWRRDGSKLAAPLKLKVGVDPSDNTIVARWGEVSFRLAFLQQFNHYPTPSIVKELTKVLNRMFSEYRELRRRGEPQTDYEEMLCEIIVDDLISSAGDRETKTYKFDNGSVQRRAGDRWFIMDWRQDGLELINPLRVRVKYNVCGTYLAKCGEFSVSNFRDPKDEVMALAATMFNRYAELLGPRGDDSEHDAVDREFLSSKIRETSVEDVVLNDAADQMMNKIDDELVLHLDGPGVDPNRVAIEGRISAKDLVAQAKVYLEKKLDD